MSPRHEESRLYRQDGGLQFQAGMNEATTRLYGLAPE
jgi:hypothetical protein